MKSCFNGQHKDILVRFRKKIAMTLANFCNGDASYFVREKKSQISRIVTTNYRKAEDVLLGTFLLI
jgi:hypothetical protein